MCCKNRKKLVELMNKKITHNLIIMAMDIGIVLFSTLFAIMIRYELKISSVPEEILGKLILSVPLCIGVTLVVFHICHMYHFVWHFVNTNDVVKMASVICLAEIISLALQYIFGLILPVSISFICFIVKVLLFIGMRCSVRFYTAFLIQRKSTSNSARIMLIGAGDAGNALLKEIIENRNEFGRVYCIIDDNPIKKGKNLFGIEIVGGRNEISNAVVRYGITQIIFAIPAAKAKDRQDILRICAGTGINVKALPGLYQLYNGEVGFHDLKDIQIEDLLGRETIDFEGSDVKGLIEGKKVLVTGGGGSIGSELCRQIMANSPSHLIILDIYENNAYDIQQELLRRYQGNIKLSVEIASIRDKDKLDIIFNNHRPEVVFHAAAHKHVPLMEDCPDEAIKNNVFGTQNVALTSVKYGVERFVLISTDKAVNPTSIMGASKRICEMLVQSLDAECRAENSVTRLVAVRFGNVLGSNGSVIPLFRKQIAEGGPVTVTHPEIVRYFMTISEAVSLVLQAGTYANGGEIFVLDMGEPVKIDDLARNLIRLSGLIPDVDIAIQYTGLRPGEKLYEEMLMAEEGLKDTPNQLIHIGKPIEMNTDLFKSQLIELDAACNSKSDDISELIGKIVPTYINNPIQ